MSTHSVEAVFRASGVSNFTGAFKDAQKSVQGFVDKNAQTFDSFRKVGAAATIAGGAIATGLGFAVKTAGNFEQAMSQVKAISGATGGEFEMLREKAIEMGDSTMFSASQSAEAMGNLAQMGWKAKEVTAGIGDVLSLAAAGGIELADSALIVANSMNQFGLEAEESERIADVFAYTSSNAGVNVMELGEALKTSGANANASGLSIEETAAFIGILGDAGVTGTRAGTALSGMLRDLKKNADDGALAVGDQTVALYDSNDEMRSMPDVIEDLINATDGMSDSQRDAALSSILGDQALAGFNSIAGQGADSVSKLTAELEGSKGTAKEMADIMKDNLNGALTELSSALEGAAIAIGDALLPYIRKATDGLKNLVGQFNSLSDSTKKFIAIGAALVAAFLLIVGPMLMLVGFIPMIVAGFSALATVGGAVVGVIGALATPILIAVGVIASLIAIGVLLYQNWETVKEKAVDVFSSFGPLLDRMKEAFSSLKGSVEPIIESLKTLWESLQPIFIAVGAIIGGVLTVLIGVFLATFTAIIASVEPFFAMIANLIDIVSGAIGVIVSLLMGDFAGAWEYMVQIGQSTLDFFINMIMTIASLIGTFVMTIIDFFHGLYMTLVGGSIIPDMVTAIVEWFRNMFQWVIDIVSNIVSGVVAAFTTIYNTIVSVMTMAWEIIKSIWSFIKSTFTNVLAFLKALVTLDFEGMKTAMQNQMQAARDLLSSIWQTIKSNTSTKLKEMVSDLVSKFQQMVSDAKSKAQEILSAIKEKFEAIKTAISDKLEDAKDYVKTKIGEMPAIVTGFVSNMVTAGVDLIGGLIQGMKDKAKDLVKAAGNIVGNAISAAKKALLSSSPSRVFIGIGHDTGDGLVIGLNDMGNRVGKAAAGMAKKAIVEPQEFNMTGRVNDINKQAKRDLTQSLNSNISVAKQPIIIQTTVDLDGNEIARSVNNVNANDAVLRRF